jgi:hypothetical protein
MPKPRWQTTRLAQRQPTRRWMTPHRTNVKDHYEDACLCLAQAIQIAIGLGLTEEVARLKNRSKEIEAVYNHQFRYVGRYPSARRVAAHPNLRGRETLDGEGSHELSVGVALAGHRQDRVGNPLPFTLICGTHPQFQTGCFECRVHGFDLGIVEELAHPLTSRK